MNYVEWVIRWKMKIGLINESLNLSRISVGLIIIIYIIRESEPMHPESIWLIKFATTYANIIW